MTNLWQHGPQIVEAFMARGVSAAVRPNLWTGCELATLAQPWGGEQARDFARNNHGDVVGGEWGYGTYHGGAFRNTRFVAASQQYIAVSSNASLEPVKTLSVSVWAKSAGATWNDTGWLVSRRDSVDEGYLLSPITGGTTVNAFVRGTDSTWYQSGAYTVPSIDVWRHYCFTLDGSTIRLYVDRTEVAEGAFLANAIFYQDSNRLFIGAERLGFAIANRRYGNGWEADARIYSRALSPAEIRQFEHPLAAYETRSRRHFLFSADTASILTGSAPSLSWAITSGTTYNWQDLVSTSGSPYSDTGLDADTRYCYRVRAVGAGGNSDWSNIACATTLSTADSATGAAPSLSWVVTDGTTTAGAATATGAAPTLTWAVTDGTTTAGTAEATGTAPSLAWIVTAGFVTAGTASATGTAPLLSWAISAGTIEAGAATVTGAAPSLSWAVTAGTTFTGSTLTGTAPSLAWTITSGTIAGGATSATGSAPWLSWSVAAGTITAGANELTGTAPSLTWSVAAGTTDTASQLTGTAPSLAWSITAGTIETGAAILTGTAPSLSWSVTAGSLFAGQTGIGTAPSLSWGVGVSTVEIYVRPDQIYLSLSLYRTVHVGLGVTRQITIGVER